MSMPSDPRFTPMEGVPSSNAEWFAICPTPQLIATRKGQLLRWNRAARAVLGWSKERVEATLGDLFPDAARHAWVMEQFAQGRSLHNVETETRSSDGSRLWLQVHARALQLGDDPPILISLVDISSQRQSEIALTELTQQLGALSRLDTGGVVSSTDELASGVHRQLRTLLPQCSWMSIMLANPHTGELDQLILEDDVRPRTGFFGGRADAPADEPRRSHFAPTEAWMAKDGTEVGELQIIGEPSPVEARMVAAGVCSILHLPLRAGGETVGSLILGSRRHMAFDDHALDMARSISLPIALGLLLLRSSRLTTAGQLAASIAHDVRNPLAIILSSTQVLLRSCGEDDPRHEMLNTIADEVRRADTQLDAFLDLSRDIPIKRVPENLVRVVRGTVDLLASRSRQQQVILECIAPDDLLVVLVDRRRMRQALTNLLINAMDAAAAHHDATGGVVPAQIRVEVLDQRETDGTLVLTIADNGPGIPEKLRSRVFDPFFTTRAEGTGLGLPGARHVIERHGGSLVLEFPETGGTTVRITLPANPETVSSDPASSTRRLELDPRPSSADAHSDRR